MLTSEQLKEQMALVQERREKHHILSVENGTIHVDNAHALRDYATGGQFRVEETNNHLYLYAEKDGVSFVCIPD